MLTITSRNLPRSAFRFLNNYLEKSATQVSDGYKMFGSKIAKVANSFIWLHQLLHYVTYFTINEPYIR